MNIKELVLKAGFSTVPASWLSEEKPIPCATANLDRLVAFAEALVAEIKRQSEPAWYRWSAFGSGNGFVRRKEEADKHSPESVVPLFTFPPSIEALEDKVAEACAAYLSNRAKPNLEAAQVMDDSVAAIRSGEWKKFRKGE